jgi:hypothetical protein
VFFWPVAPSTAADEYSNARFGAAPAIAGGTRTGYDKFNEPEFPATCHDPAFANFVAV